MGSVLRCTSWALTLVFTLEKKVPASSLLSATFHENLTDQVGLGLDNAVKHFLF